MASIRTSLVKGTLWVSGGRAFANLLTFVSTLVLARILMPADFGLVALGVTVLQILTAATNISLTSALLQHRDPTPDHFHAAWTLNLARAILIALLLAAAAWPIAQIYNEPRLVDVLLVLCIHVVLTGLPNPRAVMLMKQLVFWQQAMLVVADKLTSLIVAVTVALIFQSYWALLAGTVAGQLASVILSYTVLPFRPKIRFREGRELLSFSVWMTLGQAINTINWKLDQLLIGGFLGRSVLGFYTVGDNLAVIPSREATTPLTSTLFPAFTRVKDDPERFAAAYQKAQGLVNAVALPIGIGLALVADPFVRVFLGEKWLGAIIVVQILAAIYALQTIGTLAQPLAMAVGNTKLLFKRDSQALFIRVPLILAGLYFGGLVGLLYARAVNGCIGILFNMHIVRQVSGLSQIKQISISLRTFASLIAMALVVTLLGQVLPADTHHFSPVLKLVAMAMAGALTYAGTHVVLWLAGGRPAGAESEILRIAGGILRKGRGTQPEPTTPSGS